MILGFQLTALVVIKMVSNSLLAEQVTVPLYLHESEEKRAGNDSHVTHDMMCSSIKCHQIGLGFWGKSAAVISVQNGLDC